LKDKSQFFKGILEGCILKVIHDDEVYGYEITEKLNILGLQEISEGTIYPLLLRIEKNGLLKSKKKTSPYGPDRKYYTLTEKGEEELSYFYTNWLELKESVDKIFINFEGVDVNE